MTNARQSYCIALDDYLSVTGSPFRYFHFWKAIGNLNWQQCIGEKEQILDKKIQKAKEENNDEG